MGFGPRIPVTAHVVIARGTAFGVANGGAISAGTTRNVSIIAAIAPTATEANVQLTAPRGGTLKSYEARLTVGAAGNTTGRVRVNGANQGATLTWVAGSGESTKTGTTAVPFVAGDELNLQLTNADGANDATLWSVRFEIEWS